jgi:putative ABC transport system ATP-binding protein
MSIIKLEHVTKYYCANEYKQCVLNNISLQIDEGEMVSIMGPSGSGKSTLLNIIGLLDKQSEGSYFMNEIEVSQISDKQIASLRNNSIGFIFQSFNLIKELSVIDNVMMGLRFHNIHNKEKYRISEMRRRSFQLIESIGLKDHIDKKPNQLSGGQQQRVAIARALATNPQIILADEPTGALDQKNSQDIMNILTQLNEKGKIIIIVTHDQKVASYCKRNITMLDGNLY